MRRSEVKRLSRLWLGGCLALGLSCASEAQTGNSTAAEIREEALKPSTGGARPLPLAAHWNTGTNEGGFSPAYQMRQIEAGRHLLPWFQMPAPDTPATDAGAVAYYEAAIKQAARLKLPVSLVGTQWESLLVTDQAFARLPAEQNPNVVLGDGKIRGEVSPFGPVGPWRDAGRKWTVSPWLKKLQELYPDPPLVIFVSNNEQARLAWGRVEEESRYVKQYGGGRDEDFKRRTVGEGWIARYRALQQGMRDGLSAPAWKSRAIFIGYDAFGPASFGRWGGWPEFSLASARRIDPNPLAWDGASPSFYVYNWNQGTDYTVFSPQVESMNWVFMLEEAYRLNPKFWFEISTWDGHEPKEGNDKRKTYASRGQTFTPARYGGMVQFGLWLLRPRVAREFRSYTATLADNEPYFQVVVGAVDRVYANARLRDFWRDGRLVPNRGQQHPYQAGIPPEYAGVNRWFLLDTDRDPRRPWGLDTEIPVYSLALERGSGRERQWLVYAHAPLARADVPVTVTIPGYGPAKVSASLGGSFSLVTEKGKRVEPVR